MTKECPQTSVLRDDLISRAAVLNTLTELSCNDNAHWGVIIDAIRALPAVTASQPDPRDVVNAQLVEAGNHLSFMAQTSGGTSGRDDALVLAIGAWCDAAIAAAKGLKNE